MGTYNSFSKGGVTWDSLQWRFLAEHSVTMLEKCWNHSKQCRNAVLRYKLSLRIVSCDIILKFGESQHIEHYLESCMTADGVA